MGKLRVHNIEAQTGTNVDLGAAGDIVTLASDSIQTNLYKDSGGNTIFQSDGAGTLSNVNSGMSGAGPKLIQSQTPSGASSVVFTTGIDSTYDHYMFVFYNINVSTDTAYFQFQSSTDGGSSYGVSTTSTFFESHRYYDWSNGDGVYYDPSRDMSNATTDILLTKHCDNGATAGEVGILDLYSPSTAYVKTWKCRVQQQYYIPTSTVSDFTAGYFNTTSAINAVRFNTSSGTFDGKIKLYGIA